MTSKIAISFFAAFFDECYTDEIINSFKAQDLFMESDRLMLMEKLCKDGSLLLLFDGNATLRRKGEANYLIVAKDTKFYGLYGGDAEMYAIKTEKVSVICN